MSMKKAFDAMLRDKREEGYIAQLSTDSDELRKRFMDPFRLGSEADWWAKRRIEALEKQLADLTAERDTFYMAYRMECDKETKALEQQLAELKEEYGRACHLVAQMHATAVGEVTGPKLGVVEDVAEVRRQLAERDAEVAELKRQLYAALFEPVLMSDWRKLEQERDELRQQLAERDAALKEIQSVAESAVKTHGYDKAHVRVADIAKRATGPK